MKSSVFIGCFFLCIWSQKSLSLNQDDRMKGMKESFAKCADELKLTKEEMDKLKKKEDLSNEKYKCLAKCFCEKEKLITNGTFSREGAAQLAFTVYEGNVDDIVKGELVAEECEAKLKDLPTTCEAGPTVLGCLIEGAKAHGIMPEVKED